MLDSRYLRLLSKYAILAGMALCIFGAWTPLISAADKPTFEEILQHRMAFYMAASTTSGIPWQYLAAVDQYERAMAITRSKPPADDQLAFTISPERWAGPLNPDPNDTDPASIAHFSGIGSDGNGDGRADRLEAADAMYTLTRLILQYGTSEDDFLQAMWDYYRNPRSVKRITQISKIYAHFEHLDLYKRSFPVPVTANYSYRSTWGAKRSFGGARSHEGTDIFASYGVPVRSTCHGIVEVIGWNRYGGWRVGIRDIFGVYHYYAHLSGFAKPLQAGSIVESGQVVGWVGSSGYGKPGTQGKFPPHLHYGLYRDSGMIEWSIDPYPYLKRWEREELQRLSR